MHDNAADKTAGVTLLTGARWVVAWDPETGGHVYRTGADVAFEDGALIHVGPDYAGPPPVRTIDASGCMIMPGLVDIHTHLFSEPMNKGMWDEVGSPRLYNTSLYEYLPILRPDAEGTRAAYGVALAELALSGVTTVCDLALPSEGWLDLLGSSGLRVCIAPMFRSGRWLTRNGHSVEYEWDEAAGRRGLEQALAEIEAAEAHPSGRLFGMLCPAQVDTCTAELMRDAHAEAVRRDLRFHTHAAQSLSEFHEITRRTGMTPIEWLDDLGVLTERTIVGHGIFLDDHPWTHWHSPGSDMRRLAERGATVAHCPTVFARRGIALNHFGRYVQAGVNMGIGTDVYPHNMLDEMRLVSYLARVVAENPRDTRAADVFHAATIGGARALGRADIGRLTPGCKADFVLVDCTHPAMRPCRDPVQSLIYSAADRAVRQVFVDGREIVRDGHVLTVDYAAAAAALEEAQGRALAQIRQLDWAGRGPDAIAPPTFPGL
jgi:cytosine/adenosine deaminase-related metal-dependent hydrolase